MRLTIIGCSGSFPGPDGPASCYLVEAGGFRLLIDLGSGALGVLQRHAGLYDIDAVLLSHLHADHCLDLCGYSVARTYHPDGPQPVIPVYGPAGAAERLGRALGTDPGHGMTDAFGFRTITEGTMEVGPLRVTAAHVNHPVETFGFRLEHAGAALAYSADTGESAALERLAARADLLLCEASFAEPSAAPGSAAAVLPSGLHLTGRQAGEHAARAAAGRLMLTHLVPWNDQDAVLAAAGKAYPGPVGLAKSGMSVVLE